MLLSTVFRRQVLRAIGHEPLAKQASLHTAHVLLRDCTHAQRGTQRERPRDGACRAGCLHLRSGRAAASGR